MINKFLSKTKAIPILSIALALNLGSTAATQEYKRQSSLRFCQPRTRCTEYDICYINDIAQPWLSDIIDVANIVFCATSPWLTES